MAERVGFNNKLLIRNTLGGVPGEATRRVAGPEKTDEVLEENAEEFVKNYVQRGGE
jgi:hypothetical protein